LHRNYGDKMKTRALYFSHDSNARDDEKIIRLRMSHGWEGYGIYWAIVEMLRNANAYKLECNWTAIAFSLRTDEKLVENVVCKFDLFECKQNFFYSNSLRNRMKMKDEISQKRRGAAMARWNGDADVMQMHSKSNANKMQLQCKESKVKERKESKEKRKYSDDSLRVAEHLLNCILENKPDFKKPNIISWACEIDKAIRLDGRTPSRLSEIASWAQSSEFWSPNILSAKKLREKADTLELQMNKNVIKQQPKSQTDIYLEKRYEERLKANEQK